MKAAILRELNKELEVRDDVGLADLGPGEVHLKVVSSGVWNTTPARRVSASSRCAPCSGSGCVEKSKVSTKGLLLPLRSENISTSTGSSAGSTRSMRGNSTFNAKSERSGLPFCTFTW